MAYSQAEIRVGAQGRIVLPVELRRELNIEQGETLVARVEADQLILEKRDTVLKRVQSRFARIPPSVNLVDELIAERRAEALRES